jgi:beta-glucanase (GH16 family)
MVAGPNGFAFLNSVQRAMVLAILAAALGALFLALGAAPRPAEASDTTLANTGRKPMPIGDLRGWRQVFSADFNGSSLSGEKWYEPYDSPSHHWDPSHVTLANGLLNIDAYKDAHHDGHWWSSGVNGGKGLKQAYGKYLVRFRMDAGKGISNALMLWPTGCWPPEIDFAESRGASSSARTAHAGFLHYQGPGGCNDDRRIDAGQVHADFTKWHTIGVAWTPGKLIYTLDGAPWSTIQSPHVPATPAELVLQTESCNPICPDASTPAHVRMQVDWVVAYAPDPAAGCDAVASSGTPQALADRLAPGQRGCFRAGTYYGDLVLHQHDVTLTSYPGERATIRGTIDFTPGANRDSVTHLNLDGRGSDTNIGPLIYANGDRLAYDDITNHHSEICVLVGGGASGTLLEHNRVHDCGRLPSTNRDHGIYLENAYDTVIRDNWIHDNVDRGIQLYPGAHSTRIFRNVITDNGEGILFSDASSNNEAWDNIVAYSRLRDNVESYSLFGAGNSFHDNCVWDGDGGGGIKAPGVNVYANVIAQPRFVDHGGRNFSLRADSPCAFTGAGL